MSDGYAVTNGIRLYYVSEGEGPLVLLCHGFPEFWYSWRHQLAPIADAGFRAVAIDMPGYGRSDKPAVTYDVNWISRCLAELIPALGHERAVMVGHDWGGLLVWPFVLVYPERTAGVIGLNTPDLPRFDIPPTQVFAMASDKHNYITMFQEPGVAEQAFDADPRGFLLKFYRGWSTVHGEVFSDADVDRYLEQFSPKGAITPPIEYYRNMDRNWELLADVDDLKIEVPCLMITAEGDPVLHPGLAQGMETRVPDLETVMIEDCGHWTQQEKPKETTEHMLRYLDRLRTQTGPW
ncbi:MAG: epoxide hydrolase 4 [Actinomycetota bacterium]|nr:epoxide hydrolase 4 [Actinomycetota bacterium]